jgi:ketosteroid isomerase-like protein
MTDVLQAILDKAAIADCVHRYCRGVDRLDAETIKSAYHPDAYDDHGELKGSVDEFVAELVPLLRSNYVSTSHNICNQLVDLDGDRAFVESYLIAVHVTESDGNQWQEIVFGRYVDRFERRDGDWRIVHRVVVIDSRNTQRVEPSRLATDETKIPRGRRDGTDAVYTERAALSA